MNTKLISSLQNPLVKDLVKLSQKSQERKNSKRFIVEGVREVSLALLAGVKLHHLFICDDIYHEDAEYPVDLSKYQSCLVNVTPAVYAKLAYRSGVEGIIGVMENFDTRLHSFSLSSNPLCIVLESVEKPGNLGAILRTADAAGVDGVIICDPSTDVFNPNVIRASLGCVFSVKVSVCSTGEYFEWAKEHSITNMLASVQAERSYHMADMSKPLALVFGTEADGLSPIWYNATTEKLKIPMQGRIDSLNVSASVAILVFEAKRQRLQRL